MAQTEFNAALNQVATERGISVESVIDSIKKALVAAYRKDYISDDALENIEEGVSVEEYLDISVDLDSNTGEAKIVIKGEDKTPPGFGRIAAQTAKQVILQKIRETEKDVITKEFEQQLGELINGMVFRNDKGFVILDLGKVHGILPFNEQVQNETYRVNQRLKVLVKEIRASTRGTEVIVSRADPKFVVKLFEQEVPEIASGVVEIKAIAREAGSRTKLAVYSDDQQIDPVGSCVGQKGVRVQSIISELYGEKIDIIPFSEVTEKFIAAALSPATVTNVELDKEEQRAVVSVPEDQQSLAIGREGQNARLANKLTGWKIDIKGTEDIFAVSDVSSTVELSEESVKGVWDDLVAQVNKEDEEKKVEEPAVEEPTVEESLEDTANETTEETEEK
jgi:N utilization substance protein A